MLALSASLRPKYGTPYLFTFASFKHTLPSDVILRRTTLFYPISPPSGPCNAPWFSSETLALYKSLTYLIIDIISDCGVHLLWMFVRPSDGCKMKKVIMLESRRIRREMIECTHIYIYIWVLLLCRWIWSWWSAFLISCFTRGLFTQTHIPATVRRPSCCLSFTVQRYAQYDNSSVCLSVCLSEIISWLISGGFLLSADSNVTNLLQRDIAESWLEYGWVGNTLHRISFTFRSAFMQWV